MSYKVYEQQEFDEWCADAMVSEEDSANIWNIIEGKECYLNVEDYGDDKTKITIEILTDDDKPEMIEDDGETGEND